MFEEDSFSGEEAEVDNFVVRAGPFEVETDADEIKDIWDKVTGNNE